MPNEGSIELESGYSVGRRFPGGGGHFTIAGCPLTFSVYSSYAAGGPTRFTSRFNRFRILANRHPSKCSPLFHQTKDNDLRTVASYAVERVSASLAPGERDFCPPPAVDLLAHPLFCSPTPVELSAPPQIRISYSRSV